MSEWTDYDFESVIRDRPTDYLKRGKQVPDLFAAIGVLHPQIEALGKYIYDTESINKATGAELDRFGEYVNLPRGSMNDDDYRNAILMTRRRLSSSGTPPDAYYNAMVITESNEMVITERKSASFNLHIFDDVVIPKNIKTQVDTAAAAGVSAYVTFSRGSDAFFLAGLEKVKLILGVNKDNVLGVDDTHVIGIVTTRGLGLSNLIGLNVTPLVLGTGKNIFGVNGKALGLNKFKPITDTGSDVTFLAGTYDN